MTQAEEVGEILRLVAGWAGGFDQALTWYRGEPIPAFGERTPEAVVKAGQVAALRDYIAHLSSGGYA
jgi:hypothetical protein